MSKMSQIGIDASTISGAPAIIGFEWNRAGSSSPKLIQIDIDGNPIVVQSYYWDNHPIWGQIKRCTLTAAGVPTFGSNARGDGLTLDNAATPVMVRIPAVYQKSANPATGIYRWWFSPYPATGFALDPTFLQRGGVAKNAVYVGAYDASNWNDGGTNKLTSITGVAPLVSQVIGEFRTRAGAIGTNWGIINIHTTSLLKRLFYCEFATLDSQSAFTKSRGRVDTTSAASSGADSADTNIGTNGTGSGTGVDGITPAVWRGIENLWGNVWQFTEGWNSTDTKYRIAKSDGTTTFADTLATYDESTTTPLAGSNGYVTDILYEDPLKLMLVCKAHSGGSASTYLTDYFYDHTAGRTNILLSGGGWPAASYAGIGYLYSAYDASYSNANVGARCEFIPV